MFLLALFYISALLLWLSTFGYWWLLVRRNRNRPVRIATEPEQWPCITVVVIALNEREFIADKLNDLQKTRYEEGCLKILVVDGGSTDGTVEWVMGCQASNWPVELIQVEQINWKSNQINEAIKAAETDIVVFTDADTSLEPDCISRLVAALVNQPDLAVAGAWVKPDSILPEEQFHWRLVNRLWHMEGEIYGSAGSSGVCNAVYQSRFSNRFHSRNQADDIEWTLEATRNYQRARIIKEAIAYEHRVPDTLGEMIRIRARRAHGYHQVLFEGRGHGESRLEDHSVQQIRRMQMILNPALLLILLISAAGLLVTGSSLPVLWVAVLFLASFWFWSLDLLEHVGAWLRIKTLARWFTATVLGLSKLWLRPVENHGRFGQQSNS